MTTSLTTSFKWGRTFALVLALGIVCVACGDDDGGSAGNFCDVARKTDAAFDENFDPSDGDQLSDAISAAEEALDAAPSEIRDDLETFVEGMKAFEGVDFSDPQAAQEALAGLDQEEIEKASDNVTKYLEDECGIKAE